MINNRQAGRRRGRGGNNNGQRPGGGGGGGQRDSGNRIDSRARGNANQLYEKYKNLASDAQRQGDRVTTEYYLQFADHYFRVLSESRSRAEEHNQRRFDAQPFVGSFDTGFDNAEDEYGDEGEPIRANEQRMEVQEDRAGGEQRQPRAEDRQQEGRQQEGRQREDRPYEGRQRDGRQGERPRRDDRPFRDGQRRDEQPRALERETGEEQGAPVEGVSDDGRRFEGQREGAEGRRPRRQRDEARPVAGEDVVAAAPGMEPVSAEAPAGEDAPRRRGRPRRERPAEDAPAFDATVLPPSLGIAPAAAEVAAEGEEKPRRRRVRAAVAPEASAAE